MFILVRHSFMFCFFCIFPIKLFPRKPRSAFFTTLKMVWSGLRGIHTVKNWNDKKHLVKTRTCPYQIGKSSHFPMRGGFCIGAGSKRVIRSESVSPEHSSVQPLPDGPLHNAWASKYRRSTFLSCIKFVDRWNWRFKIVKGFEESRGGKLNTELIL